MSRIRAGIAALALVNAVLSGTMWQFWNSAPEDFPPLPPARPPLRVASLDVNGVKRQSEPSARRLFATATEAKGQGPPTPPSSAPMASQHIRLIGIMMADARDDGEPPIAVVEYGSPRVTLRLRPGDVVPNLDFRVISILRDRIEFGTKEGRLMKKLE